MWTSSSAEADRGQHFIEKLAGPADERLALQVLVAARRLADDHQAGLGVAAIEAERLCRRLERAAIELFEHRAQGVEIGGTARRFAGGKGGGVRRGGRKASRRFGGGAWSAAGRRYGLARGRWGRLKRRARRGRRTRNERLCLALAAGRAIERRHKCVTRARRALGTSKPVGCRCLGRAIDPHLAPPREQGRHAAPVLIIHHGRTIAATVWVGIPPPSIPAGNGRFRLDPGNALALSNSGTTLEWIEGQRNHDRRAGRAAAARSHGIRRGGRRRGTGRARHRDPAAPACRRAWPGGLGRRPRKGLRSRRAHPLWRRHRPERAECADTRLEAKRARRSKPRSPRIASTTSGRPASCGFPTSPCRH